MERLALVTGDTRGLGKAIALALRERGCRVVVTCRIVNVGSINGRKGQAGKSNYAVAPGYCDTALVAAVRPDVLQSIVAGVPVGRLGEPGDVARLVAFLADEAAWMPR